MLSQQFIFIFVSLECHVIDIRTNLFKLVLKEYKSFSKSSLAELNFYLSSKSNLKIILVYADSNLSNSDQELKELLMSKGKLIYSVPLKEVLARFFTRHFPSGGHLLINGPESLIFYSKKSLSFINLESLEFLDNLPLLIGSGLLDQVDVLKAKNNGPLYSVSQLPAYKEINASENIPEYALNLITILQHSPKFRFFYSFTSILKTSLTAIFIISILLIFLQFIKVNNKEIKVIKPVIKNQLELVSEKEAKVVEKELYEVPHSICPLRFLNKLDDNCGNFSACRQNIILCEAETLREWVIDTINEDSVIIWSKKARYTLKKSKELKRFPNEESLLEPILFDSQIAAVAKTNLPSIGLRQNERIDGILNTGFTDRQEIKELEELLHAGFEFLPVKVKE